MALKETLTTIFVIVMTFAAQAGGETAMANRPIQSQAASVLREYGVEEIIFAVRQSGTDHYYVNFGYYVNNPNRKGYRDGGRLCRLNLQTGKLTALLDDPKGGVRDPQVHYDGERILFSYRKGGSPYYHVYEIKADGTGLRQLTDGPWDDIEPIYLPDGDIMFCSSRCYRWVACWFTQVAILHRCDGDGRNVRMISSSIVHDNTPWVMADGRVIYTRWEYVDRSRVRYHHLWVVNPDGTDQMVYYGNMHGGTVMIDAKPIPGTTKVVASFSPGHGRPEHVGHITIIDHGAGPDERPFARRISRDANFRDPYPLSEHCFLVASGKKLLVMDGRGATQLIYELPPGSGRLECHEPRPLHPRPREHVIPPKTNLSEETGRLVLVDANFGRNMRGVQRGEIKKLLILEQLPKPVNFSGTMEPITIGGAFNLKRILGTVPVEPDGSAYMELPALRSLFFVALDENDLSVKRMQSFVTIQPGETTSCAGCHENRGKTPPSTSGLLALRRASSKIQPIAGVPEIIDFPRDVQPILDKHCLKCHDYDKRDGGVILSGDRGPWYSHSYCTLLTRGLVSHGRDAQGNRAPRTIGTSASRLMKFIDGSHEGVKLTRHEYTMIRLWIETGAAYPGTYAALGTGMVGAPLPDKEMERRCGGCHKYPPKLKKRDRRWPRRFRQPVDLLVNLSRPEMSLLLLAPLSQKAGGYGLCKAKGEAANANDSGAAEVFTDTTDQDYQKFLSAVNAAKKRLDTVKRFDMPDFRPNVHYIREMKRYSMLPKNLGPNDPINVYATDEAYWRSFWYRPVSATHKPLR